MSDASREPQGASASQAPRGAHSPHARPAPHAPQAPPASQALLPRRAAVLGGGEIGAGWAALLAAHGVPVRIADPDAAALGRARTALRTARALGVGGVREERGDIELAASAERAVRDAEWIVESLPERLEVKHDVLASLAGALAPGAIVASSSSTFTARELAHGLPCANRLVLAHPLQPVYAVPVVELAGWDRTAPGVLERAAVVLRALAREPVLVRGELPGLVANRLTAALLREAVDLIARGAISAEALDVLVARGLAPGWCVAGALGTEAIGAGAAGLSGFVERLGEPLAAVWRTLAAWPALDDARRAALGAAHEMIPAAALGAPAAEGAWAEALVRVERAARAERGGDGAGG